MSVSRSSPVNIVCVLMLSLEAFVSIFINSFITFVILRDFYLKKNLTTVQKIQVTLNISSVFFIGVSSFDVFSHLLQPDFSRTFQYTIVFTLLFIFTICSSSYLTAILCFFYFIKVVNVQKGFLGWVKKKINVIIFWLIVLVKVCSLCNSLLSLCSYISNPLPPTNGSLLLVTPVISGQTTLNYATAKMVLIILFIPLLSTVITTLLTVGFLKFHSHKMKSAQTSGEAGLTLYKRVICRMLRFLILYSAFYLVIFLYYFQVFVQYSPGYYLNLTMMFLFTPIQSVLHILDNQYLRSSWKEMIGYLLRSTNHNV